MADYVMGVAIPLSLLLRYADGTPVTRAHPTVALSRVSDGFYLDFSDNTFKADGWVNRTAPLPELSAVSSPGFYVGTINSASLLTPLGGYVIEYECNDVITGRDEELINLVAPQNVIPDTTTPTTAYRVGDVGSNIDVPAGIDLTGATSLKIHYRRPDGQEGVFLAIVRGNGVTDKTFLRYTTKVADDLNLAGSWMFRGSYDLNGKSQTTGAVYSVIEPIPSV